MRVALAGSRLCSTIAAAMVANGGSAVAGGFEALAEPPPLRPPLPLL